jgi:signal transduction histidine kinase
MPAADDKGLAEHDSELKRAVRHRELMAEFGRKALQDNDFDALLHEACRNVVEAIGTEHAKILEYRQESDDLLVRAGVGWAEGVVGRARLSTEMSSPPGHALRTAQAVLIEDITSDPEFELSSLLREHHVRALVNVPIQVDGLVYGVLECDSNAPRRFTTDDRNFLLGFANLIAAAVERQRHDAEARAAAQERERLLHELQRAKEAAEEAATSKSRLLAAAGHDLKQPLQSIVICLDLLSERLSDARDRERVERAQHAAAGLGRAFDRLLAVAHLESGTNEPHVADVPVGGILASVVDTFRPLAETKGLRIELVPSELRVRTDPDLLDQILQNLVSNAVKYTDHGRVLVGCRRRGAMVAIEVHDTGIGMPQNQIETAFQEYRRLAPVPGSGLGLGLSIVRRLADLLQHRVVVRSRPDAGSCFAIEIPRAAS